MNNISIKGVCECADLDRKVNLSNGSIVIQKEKDQVIGVYLVVSFRDNKNKYNGSDTSSYCTLVNLDSGQILTFERYGNQNSALDFIPQSSAKKINI